MTLQHKVPFYFAQVTRLRVNKYLAKGRGITRKTGSAMLLTCYYTTSYPITWEDAAMLRRVDGINYVQRWACAFAVILNCKRILFILFPLYFQECQPTANIAWLQFTCICLIRKALTITTAVVFGWVVTHPSSLHSTNTTSYRASWPAGPVAPVAISCVWHKVGKCVENVKVHQFVLMTLYYQSFSRCSFLTFPSE